MDESKLMALLEKLAAQRSCLHSSLRNWEWVVVAGIVLEFIVLITEYSREWSAYWRATIRLPEKPSAFLFLIGFIGIAMVAGGIAEELSVDSKIEGIETQIRQANEQLFGIVKESAETALSTSNAAKETAGKAQEKVAAVDERANALLAALKQPELSQTDQNAISDKVRPCAKPNTPVLVVYEFTGSLGIPIYNALKNGGFSNIQLQSRSNVWFGVSVSGPLNLATTSGCIMNGLAEPKKVPLMGLMGVSDPPGSPITIFVGEKPMGALPNVRAKNKARSSK